MRPLQLRVGNSASPWLICLELQEVHADHRDAIEAARRLLAHARRSGWRVVHVHLRPVHAVGADIRPVEGCAPRASEPVFFRDGGPTTPDHPFWRLARAAEGSQALLCGVVSDPWSVRSVEATGRIGVHLSLVRGALAGAPSAGLSEGFEWVGLRQAMSVSTAWVPEAANAP